MTILRFESMEGVRQFVGEEVRTAHIPDEAERLLHRYDERARHYQHRGQDRASAQ